MSFRTEWSARRNSISHSEMFTTNLRVMKYEMHMLLKESTHETQTANHNHTLPISKPGKAKRNISVKEVLCPHVPSVIVCWWITKRSSGLQFEHFWVSTYWTTFKNKLAPLLWWDLSTRILSHCFWKSEQNKREKQSWQQPCQIWYTLAWWDQYH